MRTADSYLCHELSSFLVILCCCQCELSFVGLMFQAAPFSIISDEDDDDG